MTERADTFHLRAVRDADLPVLMGWFDSGSGARLWGGPGFRYPFSPETFSDDCRWKSIAGFALCGAGDDMLAFGQIYDHVGRIHLARLVVRPDRRGTGLGRHLIEYLIGEGRRRWPYASASLYVYRDNEAALACYRRLGFEVAAFPAERAAFADVCFYMIRPVELRNSP